MGFGSDRDRNPEYDEAPMGRREFVRRVGLGGVVAGGSRVYCVCAGGRSVLAAGWFGWSYPF